MGLSLTLHVDLASESEPAVKDKNCCFQKRCKSVSKQVFVPAYGFLTFGRRIFFFFFRVNLKY